MTSESLGNRGITEAVNATVITGQKPESRHASERLSPLCARGTSRKEPPECSTGSPDVRIPTFHRFKITYRLPRVRTVRLALREAEFIPESRVKQSQCEAT